MFRWARFRWAKSAGSSRATRFWAFSPARGALVFAVAWLLAGCNTVLGIHKPVGTGEGSGGGIGSTVNPDAGDSDSSVVVDSGATQDGPASPCAAGMVRCNGLQPQTCNAAHWENTGINLLQPQVCGSDGTWMDTGAPCSNVCSDGTCTGACAPNQTRCNHAAGNV